VRERTVAPGERAWPPGREARAVGARGCEVAGHGSRDAGEPLGAGPRAGGAAGHCWGPSASEGPQKQDLTVFL
jgi:hypothetical protein